jgi:hypothetical protein
MATLTLAYAPLVSRVGTYLVDSGIYLAGAQGLLEWDGYCYSTHFSQPKIGFYPPMQSAWLALWWKLGGEFPGNVPWLNAGMILIGLATIAIIFVYWRRSGLSRELAGALVLAWAGSPIWIGWLFSPMSDPGFIAICLLAALIWTHPGRPRISLAWALTGVVFAIAYWWRAAALAPMLALVAVAAFGMRTGSYRSVAGFALPVVVSVVLWKAMSPRTAGYRNVLLGWFHEFGGAEGYLRILGSNFAYCLKGVPFWEMMVPSVARVPSWFHFGPSLRTAYEIAEGLVFWFLVILAIRGFRRQTSKFDWSVLWAGAAYTGQILVMPFPAGHFHRYFPVLYPFFVLWIWRGIADERNIWLKRGLVVFVTGALLTNAALSIVVLRRDTEQRQVAEFGELTSWANGNLPTEAKVAVNITLPFMHWYASTRRPIIVDYFDAKWLAGSPITHAAQDFPRADYVLMEGIDRRAEEMPELFSEVFRTSNGSYRIVKVDPDGQDRFRQARNIPEPSLPVSGAPGSGGITR